MLQEERRKSGGGRREYSSASDSETEVRRLVMKWFWLGCSTSSMLVYHQHEVPTQQSWIARLYLGQGGAAAAAGLVAVSCCPAHHAALLLYLTTVHYLFAI